MLVLLDKISKGVLEKQKTRGNDTKDLQNYLKEIHIIFLQLTRCT